MQFFDKFVVLFVEGHVYAVVAVYKDKVQKRLGSKVKVLIQNSWHDEFQDAINFYEFIENFSNFYW